MILCILFITLLWLLNPIMNLIIIFRQMASHNFYILLLYHPGINQALQQLKLSKHKKSEVKFLRNIVCLKNIVIYSFLFLLTEFLFLSALSHPGLRGPNMIQVFRKFMSAPMVPL